MTKDPWQRLRELYPWPDAQPKYDGSIHGWLSKHTWRMLASHLPTSGYVVELGSWFGKSALAMLVYRPHIKLVCIDHWRGDPHIPTKSRPDVPKSAEAFLHFCWGYQDRIVPMRESTIAGMRVVHDAGLQPSLVYVDASHGFDSVYQDIITARELFPDAVIIGDDWATKSVATAVQKAAAGFSVPVRHNTNAWRLMSEKRP